MLKLLVLLASSGAVAAQIADYGGPSILSRGGPASSLTQTADIQFRPFIGVSGTYVSGLTGIVTDSAGNIPNAASYGLVGTAGLYGLHNFKRTSVGLDYRGTYNHYPGHTYYDSTDQMLTLAISHQFAKRVSVSFNTVAGTYSRNFAFSTASGLIDPQLLTLPGNDLFDNRVIYLQTTGRMTYQKNSRLSFSFGGSGYVTRRRSSALFGVTGYDAMGDVGYRVTRFITVGASYNYMSFNFTKGFGASDIHSAQVFVTSRLTRDLELAVEMGMSRVESLFLGTVAVDPIIAAITGQTSALVAQYNIQHLPTGAIRLSENLRHHSFSAMYGRIVTPGNGVYLTSRGDTLSVNFAYTGMRHWQVAASGSYSTYHALVQNIGKYQAYQGGGGITRDVAGGLQVVARLDGQSYQTGYTNFSRRSLQATLGLYWSPGDIPLRLW